MNGILLMAEGFVPIADQVAAHLTPYFGPLNARVAVRVYAERMLKATPDALTPAHLSALLDALEPMLHTFVGQATTASLLDKIRSEVK